MVRYSLVKSHRHKNGHSNHNLFMSLGIMTIAILLLDSSGGHYYPQQKEIRRRPIVDHWQHMHYLDRSEGNYLK